MFLIDRRILLRFDWLLFLLPVGIVIFGIINIYSAGYSLGPESMMYKKQIYWLIIGSVFLVIGAFLDYSRIERYSYPFYLGTLALLVYVLFQGKLVSGSQRWISFGFFNLQPSELVKISLILVLAKWFQLKYEQQGYTIRSLFLPSFFVVIPFALIYLQPDLGTALILLLVFFSIAFFVKIRFASLAILSFCFLSIIPLAWNFLLKPYQKDRVIAFLNPNLDPKGSGYQIIQSKIAVGSGEFFGKGFIKGTQSQLNFIPEKYTDFVFSVFCEEWGFLGAFILLGLYFFLFVRLALITAQARDSFGMILGYGLTIMFLWHFIINLGMVLGLLPIVGIPLPLFSYGGSSLVITMFSIGIMMNIHIKRYIF